VFLDAALLKGQEMDSKRTIPVMHKKDGSIVVSFSQDDMEARADFLPPLGGAPISQGYIDALLSRLNITHGVKLEVIEKNALAVNLSKRPKMDVPIAEGTPPVAACPAYFEKNRHLIKERPATADNEQVDYRKFSPFIIVRKGQILAELIAETAGCPGRNVHGEEIPFETRVPPKLAPGVNAYRDGKYLYAAVSGQVVDENGIISVSEKLVIDGDVNYNTGNINFPGDVEIHGSVEDGFKIYSGGNLRVMQTFTATEANIKGAIEVLGGIIGRGPSTVKAGGEIRTRFIENCHIAARGNITVTAEILNAHVYTMGMLNAGSRGFIMGVEIYALHGMKCAKIGRTVGKTCKIHVGVDFTVQSEIDKNINYQRLFAVKLEKLKALISAAKDTEGNRYQKMIELRNRLNTEITRLSGVVEQLQSRLVVDEKASVTVSGEIAQGTLIEICQVALFVEKPLRCVTLKLDKTQGKIVQAVG
jgi:uncharacterized protein (DUF342 family)